MIAKLEKNAHSLAIGIALHIVQQHNLGTLLHRRQIHAISDHSTWNTCMRLYVSCGETTGSTHDYAPHCRRRMWQLAYAAPRPAPSLLVDSI